MTNTPPEHHEYFMGIAMAVRRRANCLGNRVGAIIVIDRRIVATGYNGTPENMENCLDGGCHRCANRDKYLSGTGYDLCICVHAEQNALLAAARFGIPVANAVLYSTMRPCFGCTKELLQAKISAVYFLHDWSHPDTDKQAEYARLQARFPNGIKRIDLDDPDAIWAVSALRAKGKGPVDETGHQA
ncbi:deoxycytidylate deaminase [Nitrospira sp. BLG_2]|uniref:deoxycytidylate deaminase n=1 Tax=Nitrospira sp. BLG_2 TaxID=3397507 RepID=UPI003B9C3078